MIRGMKLFSRVKLVFGVILLCAATQVFVFHVFSAGPTKLLGARIRTGVPSSRQQQRTVPSPGVQATKDNNIFFVCISGGNSSGSRNDRSSNKNISSNSNSEHGRSSWSRGCKEHETDGHLFDGNKSNKTLPTTAGLDLRRCEGVHLTKMKYLIRGDSICGTDQIDVVILIHSATSNFPQRRAIRNTWGNASNGNLAQVIAQRGSFQSGSYHSDTLGRKTKREVPIWNFQTGTFRLVFLLGQTLPEMTDNDAIKAENATFGDIVQGNFVDTYRNLSLKTVMGLTWVTQWCPLAQFVFKTDDDAFVNTRNLLDLIRTNATQLHNGIGGRCSQCSKPVRRTDSKWYISYDLFPGEFYPEFCSGVGYVMSMRVAELLRTCFERVVVFPLEDIYVAFCMYELGLKGLNLAGFYTAKPPSIPCLYKQDNLFVLTLGLSPRLLELIWTTPCDSGLAFNNKDIVNKWLAGLIV